MIVGLTVLGVLVLAGGLWFAGRGAVGQSGAPRPTESAASEPMTSEAPASGPSVSGSPTLLAPGDRNLTIDVGGRKRSLILHVPTTTTGPLPLVLVFHGAYGTAADTKRTTDFDRAADAHGFLVAYLQGYQDFWNDLAGHTAAQQAGMDDVAFASAAIDEISRLEPVDQQRVVAAGFSNGALLADVLGCQLADRLALIVVASGPFSEQVSQSCNPARPVSVLETHGTADPTIPYDGGHFSSDTGGETVLSAPDSAARWAQLDGCDATPSSKTISNAVVTSYSGCRDGTTVTLRSLQGWRHAWPPSVGELVAEAMDAAK